MNLTRLHSIASYPHLCACLVKYKRKGNITIFGYKKWKKFISVCLELDIVKEGTKREVLTQEMIEAVKGMWKRFAKQSWMKRYSIARLQKNIGVRMKSFGFTEKSKVPRQAGSLNFFDRRFVSSLVYVEKLAPLQRKRTCKISERKRICSCLHKGSHAFYVKRMRWNNASFR